MFIPSICPRNVWTVRQQKDLKPLLDPDSCTGFHRGAACRVCGGFHLACSSGKCRVRRQIPPGHLNSTALHCTPTSWNCTQGGCPVCLPWCNRKGKLCTRQQDTVQRRRTSTHLEKTQCLSLNWITWLHMLFDRCIFVCNSVFIVELWLKRKCSVSNWNAVSAFCL